MWFDRIFRKSLTFYTVAVGLSFILSLIILSYHQPFNNDAIWQYLKFSKIYLEKGFSAASEASRWPFYPLLIAWITRISHLSLEASSYLIDAILDAATVVIFLLLVRELGGRRRTQWFALAVVLLFPLFSHARNDIMREHGYYCFSLLSFWYLIRYVRWGYLSYSIGWGLSILLATLFRIEGSFIALLAPMAVWFRWSGYGGALETTKRFLKAYFVIALVTSFIFIAITINHSHFLHFFGRLWDVKDQFLQGLKVAYKSFLVKSQLIEQTILSGEDSTHGSLLTITLLISVFIIHLIKRMEWLYIILFFYGLANIKKFQFDTSAQIVWITFILCNLVISSLFLVENFFLTGRYIGLLIFLLLLMVPFSLELLYQQWKNKMRVWNSSSHWIIILVLVAWIHVALSALGYFGPSKVYLIQTGKWIKINIPISSHLYTNNLHIAYYAGRYYEGNVTCNLQGTLSKDEVLKNDYAALDINRKNKALSDQISQLPLERLKAFCNRRGDCAIVLKVLHNSLTK